ncbi:MAG: hypothetical protein R3240_13195, partial [Gammaproteobacteria bacterium]|nr:hypothetical protein [Gammaproteobacteria bacterium]
MNSDLRQEIADEAARIILEHGETNYYLAKQKAAKQKSVVSQSDLPTNQEIEEQVKRRLSLFDGKAQQDLIRSKRLEALSAMKFLQEFAPALTGPVLDGTASKYSPIEIHLFVDTVEQVTIF